MSLAASLFTQSAAESFACIDIGKNTRRLTWLFARGTAAVPCRPQRQGRYVSFETQVGALSPRYPIGYQLFQNLESSCPTTKSSEQRPLPTFQHWEPEISALQAVFRTAAPRPKDFFCFVAWSRHPVRETVEFFLSPSPSRLFLLPHPLLRSRLHRRLDAAWHFPIVVDRIIRKHTRVPCFSFFPLAFLPDDHVPRHRLKK